MKNRRLNLNEDFFFGEHHDFGTKFIAMIEGAAIFVWRTKRGHGLKKNPGLKKHSASCVALRFINFRDSLRFSALRFANFKDTLRFSALRFANFKDTLRFIALRFANFKDTLRFANLWKNAHLCM